MIGPNALNNLINKEVYSMIHILRTGKNIYISISVFR